MLYSVGTPIGNLEDMTLRGVRILTECVGVIAENPSHTHKLLAHYQIPKKPVITCNEHTTPYQIERIVEKLATGEDWAMVSDAGTPGISDPGGRLIAACVAAGVEVSPIPGVSSLTALVSVAGIPLQEFSFVGFLPKKKGGQTLLARLADHPWPIVLLESPQRLAKTCGQLHEVWGDREIIVGRELTKLHEEIWRGSLAQAADHFEKFPPKGEIVLVVDRF